MEKKFGLIGATVSHSFSKAYFDEKFFREGLRDYHYDLYPLKTIDDLTSLLKSNPELAGLNVTIPYKEKVMKFLAEVDPVANSIGAVNVIKISGGKLKGYNTDSAAFQESVEKWYPATEESRALILGTGGSSKAVRVALKKLNIPFSMVSRDRQNADYDYEALQKQPELFEKFNLIINTTPLGMSPNTDTLPPIDYEQLTPKHFRCGDRPSKTVWKCCTSRLRNPGRSGIIELLG